MHIKRSTKQKLAPDATDGYWSLVFLYAIVCP